MSPPFPPSPPAGPPRGTYFSLRNATQPLPPSPAFTRIFASSANTGYSIRERFQSEHTPGLGVKTKIRAPANGGAHAKSRFQLAAVAAGFFSRAAAATST